MEEAKTDEEISTVDDSSKELEEQVQKIDDQIADLEKQKQELEDELSTMDDTSKDDKPKDGEERKMKNLK